MTRFRSDLAAALVLAGLLSAVPALADPSGYGRKLMGGEIRALAPGVYGGSYRDKLKLVINLKPDGNVTGTANGKPQRGKWRVDGSDFCMTVQFLIFSKTRCGPIYTDGKSYFGMFNKRGKPRLVLRPAGKGSI